MANGPSHPLPILPAPTPRQRLTARVRATAAANGLALAAVATAEPFSALVPLLLARLAAGRLDGFDWFTPERAIESADPRTIHPDPVSILSVGLAYHVPDPGKPDDGVPRGRIARYARGADYHRLLRQRMDAFVEDLARQLGRDIVSRRVTDTARIVDRAVAARAGLGWYGKNACIIVPGHGSWVLLGEILLDLDLEPDPPLDRNCGRCSICIDACPTGAIVAPYEIDAPRCLSFQTIEQRGPIPRHLRPLLGDWVFGCDVCQDVCPYCHAAAASGPADPRFAPRAPENAYPSLPWLLTMTEEQFRATWRGTPVIRAKRRGLARNAAVALAAALAGPDEALVRLHAAWALGRFGGRQARAALYRARANDPDADVRAEAALALDEDRSATGGPARTGSAPATGAARRRG
ncbi:MAG: tRNA epoxyqueuosine(34) reductase QueG [Chloroflexota bacterium]